MNKEEFIQRTSNAAGQARRFSWSEMMVQRQYQPCYERLAKVAFGKTLSRFIPNEITIGDRVYNLLTSGGEQLVYANSRQVAKVIFGTLTFEQATAESVAGHYQSQYALARRHLESRLTNTDFGTKRVRGGVFAAIALQPRLQPEYTFKSIEDMIMYRDDPAYTAEVESLYDGLMDLYEDSGLQMDLHGSGNIFLLGHQSRPQMTIVDTIPVSPDRQQIEIEGIDMNHGQFNQTKLSQMLQAVRVARLEPGVSAVQAVH
jgi:hypothetical protein